MDVEGVFKDVGCISTHSYTSAGCQIATESTHRLHHEYSSLRPSGRLLDLVATLMRGKKSKWLCEETVGIKDRVQFNLLIIKVKLAKKATKALFAMECADGLFLKPAS